MDASSGAIPKRIGNNSARSRVIANPMSDEGDGFAADANAYFCLKSILKQNRQRRYTLITARELHNLSDGEEEDEDRRGTANRSSYHEGCPPPARTLPNIGEKKSFDPFSRSRESLDGRGRRRKQSAENEKGEEWKEGGSNRTLIFASPIQEVCPGDPFGGKDVVRTRQEVDSTTPTEEAANQTVLGQLGLRSLDRRSSRRRECRYSDTSCPPSFSCPPDRQHPYPYAFSASTDAVDAIRLKQSQTRAYRHGASFPPYEGGSSGEKGGEDESKGDELQRSFTERRTRSARSDANFRRSFTGRVEDYRAESNNKWANLNMETSL